MIDGIVITLGVLMCILLVALILGFVLCDAGNSTENEPNSQQESTNDDPAIMIIPIGEDMFIFPM